MARYKIKIYTYDGKLVETRGIEGSRNYAIKQADIILDNYGWCGRTEVGEARIERIRG